MGAHRKIYPFPSPQQDPKAVRDRHGLLFHWPPLESSRSAGSPAQTAAWIDRALFSSGGIKGTSFCFRSSSAARQRCFVSAGAVANVQRQVATGGRLMLKIRFAFLAAVVGTLIGSQGHAQDPQARPAPTSPPLEAPTSGPMTFDDEFQVFDVLKYSTAYHWGARWLGNGEQQAYVDPSFTGSANVPLGL